MVTFATESLVGRLTRKVATSRAFRVVGPTVVPAVDKVLHRVTGGRVLLSQAMVPSMILTTTGRKSGQARPAPLACVPDDHGGWWVVGSNFGREHHPAWTGNLLAQPEATVAYEQRTVPVRAELLADDEKARVWPRLTAVWPAYDNYVETSNRNLRVFHLRPVDQRA